MSIMTATPETQSRTYEGTVRWVSIDGIFSGYVIEETGLTPNYSNRSYVNLRKGGDLFQR